MPVYWTCLTGGGSNGASSWMTISCGPTLSGPPRSDRFERAVDAMLPPVFGGALPGGALPGTEVVQRCAVDGAADWPRCVPGRDEEPVPGGSAALPPVGGGRCEFARGWRHGGRSIIQASFTRSMRPAMVFIFSNSAASRSSRVGPLIARRFSVVSFELGRHGWALGRCCLSCCGKPLPPHFYSSHPTDFAAGRERGSAVVLLSICSRRTNYCSAARSKAARHPARTKGAHAVQ